MEQKMGGHQFFFGGGLEEGLEFPFNSLHFHSFVFNALPYFGKMFEEGSFLNFFKAIEVGSRKRLGFGNLFALKTFPPRPSDLLMSI